MVGIIRWKEEGLYLSSGYVEDIQYQWYEDTAGIKFDYSNLIADGDDVILNNSNSSGPVDWREIFMEQSVDKCR